MRTALMIAAATLLSACVLPPKQATRAPSLEAGSVGLHGVPVEAVADDWWSSFADPQLDALIRAGLKDSPTLAEAQDRVRSALAQTQVARARTRPNANLDGSVAYQHAPESYLVPAPLAGHGYWEGQAGLSLGWDLDFWGKQADAVRRAQALTQAARYDLDNSRLMLAGAIAQSYVDLYRAYARVDIAERSEAQRQNIVNITRRRVAAGLDTQLEVREAEGQLPQARVARTQAQANAELAVHQLAVLTGQGADGYAAIRRPTLAIDAVLPVPAALPINLLARRPDVWSARLGIDAADAQRRADRAAFYPSVSLQALAGIGAFGLSNLFDWSARGASVGPAISLPLFDGGRLKAQYQDGEAQLDAAVASYNDTVLEAVRQTADQLSRLDALARERVDQQQTLDATESAYRLAEERYQAGLAGYLTVLNAETQVLSARQGMVDILADQALARVTLLLAVGGSFDPNHAAGTTLAANVSVADTP